MNPCVKLRIYRNPRFFLISVDEMYWCSHL